MAIATSPFFTIPITNDPEPSPVPEPTNRAICARCTASTPTNQCRVGHGARLLCAVCKVIECWDCGADTPDVMQRNVHRDGGLPALCTACCATYPGRAWMQHESAALEEERPARMPQVQRSATESTSPIPSKPA